MEPVSFDPTDLRDQHRHVVGLSHGGSLDRAIGLLADDFVRISHDLVGAEAFNREQHAVGDSVHSDDPARHLEVLSRLGQVVVGGVSGAGTAGEGQCGGGDDDDGLAFHVRSFGRWRMTRSCSSETGQLAPS